MKTVHFFIIAFLLAKTSYSLEIGGVLDSDLTLIPSDNPHYVTSILGVPQGITLTITPGVELFFHDQVYTEIGGTIIATGSPELPILFTGVDETSLWGGFMLYSPATDYNEQSNSGCRFEYCIFNSINLSLGVEELLNTGWAVAARDTKFKVDHCTAHNAAFFTFGTGAIVTNSILDHSGFVVDYSSSGPSLFENNEIFNSNGLSSIVDMPNGIISSNYFHDNHFVQNLIRFQSSNISVTNNTFINNDGIVMAIVGGQNHEIIGNLFDSNDVVIWMFCERQMTVSENCFINTSEWNLVLDGGDIWGEYPFAFYDCANLVNPATIDFTNNSFNGLSDDDIDATILDATDDISQSQPFTALYNPQLLLSECTTPASLREVEVVQSVMAFPNPCDEFLQIGLNNPNSSYIIINSMGKIVASGFTTTNAFTLDTSHLAPGYYVLNSSHQRIKFLVSH